MLLARGRDPELYAVLLSIDPLKVRNVILKIRWIKKGNDSEDFRRVRHWSALKGDGPLLLRLLRRLLDARLVQRSEPALLWVEAP